MWPQFDPGRIELDREIESTCPSLKKRAGLSMKLDDDDGEVFPALRCHRVVFICIKAIDNYMTIFQSKLCKFLHSP